MSTEDILVTQDAQRRNLTTHKPKALHNRTLQQCRVAAQLTPNFAPTSAAGRCIFRLCNLWVSLSNASEPGMSPCTQIVQWHFWRAPLVRHRMKFRLKKLGAICVRPSVLCLSRRRAVLTLMAVSNHPTNCQMWDPSIYIVEKRFRQENDSLA